MDTKKTTADDSPTAESTSSVEDASPSPIPNGGLIAWLQVAGSFCLYFCTWASFGSFQTIYELDQLSPHTPFQISIIGSLQTFLMVFSGFIVGPVYDSGYFRHLLAVGSSFIVIGTVLQSLSTKYWQYLLTQGLMIGIGAGCLSILSVAVTSLWFTTRLALVNGLAACGSGLGGVLLPIMVRELNEQTSLPWATRSMALLLLVLLAFSNLVLRPGPKSGGPKQRRQLLDKTAFTDWPYVLFVLGCFSVFLGMYTPFVYVQSYALDNNIASANLAGNLLAILNSSSIFGRILPAFLAQRLGPMNTIIGAAVLLATTSLCLISANTTARLLVAVISQGFFTGSFFALQPTIFVRLTSYARRIGTRFGMAFSVMSVALLFGPPVGGALRKSMGYTASWVWAGLTIFVGGMLILCSRLLKDIYSNVMSLNTPAAGQSAPVNNPEAISSGRQDLLYNYSTGNVDVPRGFKYRQYRIFGYTLPWYASPKIQLGMVAFVCFMCPGMFNALNGMGGGGRVDTKLVNDMNTALYSTFAVVGFFGGTFVNKLGVKLTLALGGIGYGIYTISILLYNHFGNDIRGFNIFAGVLLGFCAAMLWTAQGTIMISYPHEHQKGHYFAWFWGIFNLGAVIGSLIPLGSNINSQGNVNVNDGTYIGFIVLMFFGATLALLLCNANDVVRKDGSYVILMKNPTWQSELLGLYETIRFEPFVIFLFPMFFSSNWFYVYQQNAVNGAYFATKAKALNSLLYWLAQIAAAAIWGYLLDLEYLRRSVRAKIALVVLFALTFIVWGGGYVHERTYTRATTEEMGKDGGKEWDDAGYAGPLVLYIFYGFYDAAWQATVYWFMGALSNSGRRCANYIGFYKGIQSAGAAISNNLDARKVSFEAQFISNWILLASSLVIAAPVIFLKIRDHVAMAEDLEGTDETLADVAPTYVLTHPRHNVETHDSKKSKQNGPGFTAV
ncbi:unnamed protein product [Fusarium graminearum]|uniref:Major facilitator superfamily (MFS) profile domain-containing protein n=1 Tax=Gibberella zeae TaxID=5518 RepID=A0A9N8NI06_GIBZA|nr:unnamed protein product [Fusarium graminearum]